MLDVRELCKIFLDFVYDNNILPSEITSILKETDNGDSEWDFRLICKLLQYKEDYTSLRNDSIEQKLALNAGYLRSINIWRDTLSRNRLQNLWQTTNVFFHNVATTDSVFKNTIIELINSTNKENKQIYINRISVDNDIKPLPPINITKDNSKTKGSTALEPGRARYRIPKWALHPNQYNHIIMWAFFKAASIDGEDRVTKEFMQSLCRQRGMTDKQFDGNYAAMKTDKGNAHGKTFEEIGPYVRLWEYVRPVALEYKSYFLPQE